MEWRGTVTAAIEGATADQAWPLLRDFCSLHLWVPSIHTCRLVSGVDGQPGCVRYCAGPVNRSSASGAAGSRESAELAGWSKERLVRFDDEGRSYSYEVVETNKGFGRYEASVKVVPRVGGGCTLEWSFEAEPVQGWTREAFVAFLEELAQGVAVRLEETAMKTGGSRR